MHAVRVTQRTFLTSDGREVVVPRSANPCIALYGDGPADKRCRDCAQMYARDCCRRYWKCRLRKETHGPGSDHRRGWPTCGKFVEAGDDGRPQGWQGE
jgi:hypothetical protein